MSRVAMVVPSRGRPESVARQVRAWEETQADDEAVLVWALDADDPGCDRYLEQTQRYPWMRTATFTKWQPMVPKLNLVATAVASSGEFDVVGFMGDDHLPRTLDWPVRLAAAYAETGHGIFYGQDGFQDVKLPTWWAMSAEVVRTLGGMVPSGVEHLYCDNTILDMGKAARILRYLPRILIEHMHPVVFKSEMDDGYRKVNSAEQYEKDRAAFLAWRADGLHECATMLRELSRGG